MIETHTGTEGIDYVVCPFCGGHYQLLHKHFKGYWTGHNMSDKEIDDYCKQHPEVKMMSDVSYKRISDTMILKWEDQAYRDKVESGQLKYIAENAKKSHEHQVKAGKLGARRTAELHPNQLSEMRKRAQELYPDNWQAGLNYLNDNSPFCYMGIGWHNSPIQQKITQLLFEKLGIIPIKGVNCQVYSGGNEFDFKLLGFIYEPHVLHNRGSTETREEYCIRKRNAMDNNGLKDYELIVTTTLPEAEHLIEWLSDKIDFLSPTIKEEVK